MSSSLTQFLETRKLLKDPEPTDHKEPEIKDQEGQLRDKLFQTGSTFKLTSRDEIVGIDNVLGEIEEIIHWLKHSVKYSVFNARLQPGVVFCGHPGTGKTLVSRWIATESKSLFINVRDFPHKAALFTDADLRDLFRRARETYEQTHLPIVLFWDEFENSAADRNGEKATPEQRAVVSQLTAELDGIHGKNEGILLIGCTNHLDAIDTALLRRGRMGVQIEFHAPDRQGKEKILAYYLKQMNCTPGIDINTLSYFFPKHNTAADIEEACVEAWRHAVHRSINQEDEPQLASEDLVKVFIKQLVGPPTTFVIPEDERMPIAVHETGHAIVALAFGVPLRLITVQPGKKSLGRIMIDDLKEYIGTLPESLDHMRVTLGGVAGEHIAELEPMTGSVSDLQSVSSTAAFLVDHLTAGEQTGITNITSFQRTVGYSNMNPQVSHGLLVRSDEDVLKLIEQVKKDAYRVLLGVGKENLYKIAGVVNEKVTMTGKEFRQLFIDICDYEPESLP